MAGGRIADLTSGKIRMPNDVRRRTDMKIGSLTDADF
jgi:hypothetical protein